MTKKININAPIVYKSYWSEGVNIAEESRIISGYLAVFGNRDSEGDIILKGAFKKSLAERGVGSKSNRKIVFLWQHDTREPLGMFTVLKEDNYGLYFEAKIDNIELGDRCITQLKSGTLNQFSIGFQYILDKTEYDESIDSFIIHELNLFEGSVVTMGANDMTYFSGMKAVEIENREKDLRKETDLLLKELDYSTQLLVRQLISKHISLSHVKSPKQALINEKAEEVSIFTQLKLN